MQQTLSFFLAVFPNLSVLLSEALNQGAHETLARLLSLWLRESLSDLQDF